MGLDTPNLKTDQKTKNLNLFKSKTIVKGKTSIGKDSIQKINYKENTPTDSKQGQPSSDITPDKSENSIQ